MSLRNAVIARRIVFRAVDRPETAVARNAPLEFFAGLVADRFFEVVGAAAKRERARKSKGGEEGLQACRLSARLIIARK